VNQGRFILQSQIPFKEIMQRFLDIRVPQLGAATQAKYRTHIENHIGPAFGKLRMCDIDRPSVEAWLNHKAQPITVKLKSGRETQKSGLGWWARQDLRNILSAIFSKAAEWKLWAGENPCIGVEVGRKRECREKRIPKSDQLTAFLAALPDTAICSAEDARLMVLTVVIAGLRVSEVLGLQPRDYRRCRRNDRSTPPVASRRR